MSTTNPKAQEQAEKPAAAQSGAAKKTAGTDTATRRPAPGAKGGDSRPVKDANAPRSSLLDLYFGEGAVAAKKEPQEAVKKPSRVAERRPPAEVIRPAAERALEGARVAPRGGEQPAGRKPAAARRQAAGAPAREQPAAEPAAQRPEGEPQAPERPAAETAPVPAPAAEQTPAAAGTAPPAEVPGADEPAAPAAEEAPRSAAREGRARAGAESAPVRPAAEIQRPPARPRPAAEISRPTPPLRPVGDGPRPGGQVFSPRPVGPAPPPPQRIIKPAAPPPPRPAGVPGPTSGLGRPTPPGQRSIGAPGRPSPGGPGRGPRPGGGRGRPLTIPKVDPKVAEQQKQEAKRPTAAPDKRKDRLVEVPDDFEAKRDRPPEEKLFGRRGGRGATVARRVTKTAITIELPVTVKELAHEMGITAAEVIKKLLGLGMMVTINQELDADTAQIVAGEFGVQVNIKAPEFDMESFDQIEDPDEADAVKRPRPPVVVIMGHVDHGKTTLLDAIRETRVAAGEAGGITQHIGAYQTDINGRKITFLDTPGHEAFTAMRARGARATDVAVLVVAADDGVMPQTIEAINHAKAAQVPIVVAINKMDKENANPERVKTDLTGHGLVVEEWGGDVVAVPVSAKAKQNLELLLENILLVAEVQDLKANPDKDARGTILEAELDKGRGPVGTVLVQGGTLRVGDPFVCGSTWGKVRAMFDDRGKKIKKAGPSTPVQVLGFDNVPEAGDVFRVVPDEKIAREVADKRNTARRAQEQVQSKQSLEDLMKAGEMRDLTIIVKGDVMGSVEAVRQALEKLENAEARVKVIHGAVGAVTESDVMLASASNAMILGFNVRPDDRAALAARQQNVEIRTYRIIYEAVDEVKAALTGMLKPRIEEVILGKAAIRAVFKVPKIGNVAGSQVVDGKIERNARVRLLRDNTVVWEGGLASLKRFKDDVREVTTGQECGIGLDGYNDIKEGDVIEAFTMRELKPGE